MEQMGARGTHDRGVVPIAITCCVLAGSALAACGRPAPSTSDAANAGGATRTVTPVAPLHVALGAPSGSPTVAAPEPPLARSSRAALPELTFRRPVDAAAPLRVGYIGDSVAFSIILALREAGLEFVARTHLPMQFAGGFNGPGFGLTADIAGHNDIGPTPPPSAFANWRTSVQKMVVDPNPDIVIVLVGTWDTIERSPFGRPLQLGTPEWRRWYRGLADQFVRTLTARGADVVWILMPCVGRRDLNQRLIAVNSVLRDTTHVAPGHVGFVALSDVACRNDEPIYKVPGPTGTLTLREADGIHFVPGDAQKILAPFFVQQFEALLRPILPASRNVTGSAHASS
jgi:hypothetical protein